MTRKQIKHPFSKELLHPLFQSMQFRAVITDILFYELVLLIDLS
jgi:hypothetical protein